MLCINPASTQGSSRYHPHIANAPPCFLRGRLPGAGIIVVAVTRSLFPPDRYVHYVGGIRVATRYRMRGMRCVQRYRARFFIYGVPLALFYTGRETPPGNTIRQRQYCGSALQARNAPNANTAACGVPRQCTTFTGNVLHLPTNTPSWHYHHPTFSSNPANATPRPERKYAYPKTHHKDPAG